MPYEINSSIVIISCFTFILICDIILKLVTHALIKLYITKGLDRYYFRFHFKIFLNNLLILPKKSKIDENLH